MLSSCNVDYRNALSLGRVSYFRYFLGFLQTRIPNQDVVCQLTFFLSLLVWTVWLTGSITVGRIIRGVHRQTVNPQFRFNDMTDSIFDTPLDSNCRCSVGMPQLPKECEHSNWVQPTAGFLLRESWKRL
jgi:hypothetical protein